MSFSRKSERKIISSPPLTIAKIFWSVDRFLLETLSERTFWAQKESDKLLRFRSWLLGMFSFTITFSVKF